ncbi:protein of unknown function [Azospirillum baldaniorum]|uniref:Uncharacterized protein n=1 Tax=Azospirillum baldaniorum TaxID=1064539 RepID=A0A9P1JRU0_9PROT|nr:protein of unknown function [Azospirillum baldaniorum]
MDGRSDLAALVGLPHQHVLAHHLIAEAVAGPTRLDHRSQDSAILLAAEPLQNAERLFGRRGAARSGQFLRIEGSIGVRRAQRAGQQNILQLGAAFGGQRPGVGVDDAALRLLEAAGDGIGEIVPLHHRRTAADRAAGGVQAEKLGIIRQTADEFADAVHGFRREGDSGVLRPRVDEAPDLHVGHQRQMHRHQRALDRRMLAQELVQVLRHADHQQRHRDRAVGQVLEQLGQLVAEILVGDAIILVEDQQHMGGVDAGQHLVQLRHAESALGQQLVEAGEAAARGEGVVDPRPVIGGGDLLQEMTEDVLEAQLRAAGQFQREVAGLAGDLLDGVGDGGLAAAPVAEQDDVRPLLLDGGDDALQRVGPADEQRVQLLLGPRRREGLAQQTVQFGSKPLQHGRCTDRSRPTQPAVHGHRETRQLRVGGRLATLGAQSTTKPATKRAVQRIMTQSGRAAHGLAQTATKTAAAKATALGTTDRPQMRRRTARERALGLHRRVAMSRIARGGARSGRSTARDAAAHGHPVIRIGGRPPLPKEVSHPSRSQNSALSSPAGLGRWPDRRVARPAPAGPGLAGVARRLR